jgi:hypothetical protein
MKIVRFLSAFWVELFLCTGCIAQQDTIQNRRRYAPYEADSLLHTAHNPNKATLSSGIFPGAGQFYNRKYLEGPHCLGSFRNNGLFLLRPKDSRFPVNSAPDHAGRKFS